MKAFLRETDGHVVVIDVEGDNAAERVLLQHLSEQHHAVACVGCYSDGPHKGKGMRFLVMNNLEEQKPRRRR